MVQKLKQSGQHSVADDEDPFAGVAASAKVPDAGPPERKASGVPADLLRGPLPPERVPRDSDGKPLIVMPELSPNIPRDEASEMKAAMDPRTEGFRVVDQSPHLGRCQGEPQPDVPSRRWRVLEEARFFGGLLRKGKVIDERAHDVERLLRCGVKLEEVEE